MSGGPERFEWSPEVLFRSSGQDMLLAPPDRDDFELLSGTAGVVWRLLGTPMTFSDLVGELADLYGADQGMIARDVQPLLEDLRARGLVHLSPENDD